MNPFITDPNRSRAEVTATVTDSTASDGSPHTRPTESQLCASAGG